MPFCGKNSIKSDICGGGIASYLRLILQKILFGCVHTVYNERYAFLYFKCVF